MSVGGVVSVGAGSVGVGATGTTVVSSSRAGAFTGAVSGGSAIVMVCVGPFVAVPSVPSVVAGACCSTVGGGTMTKAGSTGPSSAACEPSTDASKGSCGACEFGTEIT